ncbi:hypothetical protein GEMRC1_011876 [Eukaryota sp. GEM-RC1]
MQTLPVLVEGSFCPLYFYLSAHRGSASIFPVGRTLFLSNYANLDQSTLQTFFQSFGDIESITMSPDKNHTHIVFVTRESLQHVLSLTQETAPAISLPSQNYLGSWVKSYRSSFKDCSSLQEEITSFIESCDRQKEDMPTGDPDNEGFINVTSGRRSTDSLAPKKKKKKNEVGDSFYAFHRRNKRTSELQELRKAFEEDKQKIQRMRASRSFRP